MKNAVLTVLQKLILFNCQNPVPQFISPPIVVEETKNVLNPDAKDFLFSPTCASISYLNLRLTTQINHYYADWTF